MQEKKKKNLPKNLEREGERGNLFFFFFFVSENYAQNRRDGDKFIVRGCE